MESDCKALIDKYVRSDSVIACLELTGYTSAILIRNLDSNQIDQIEEFVRHACTVMNPNQARTFLGSVFSSHADKFCFPIGVRMGLMLAVNELKSLNGNNTMNNNKICNVDKSIQTEITIGCSFSSFLNPNLNFLNKLTANNSIFCDLSSLPSTPISNVDQQSDGSFIDHIDTRKPANDIDNHRLDPMLNEINIEHLKQHSSASAIRLASRQFINANLIQNRHFRIDMEVNPTPDSNGTNGNGPLRVTGIFNCHLCREKRDRSTPVRFSIARNRYPVMSNVLSHLKIHFQPLLMSPTATSHDSSNDSNGGGGGNRSVESHNCRRTLIKQENLIYSQSDPSGVESSLSPFNLDHLMMASCAGNAPPRAPPSPLGDMKMFPAIHDK